MAKYAYLSGDVGQHLANEAVFTIGGEAANVIIVTMQLYTAAGVFPTRFTAGDLWLSDAAAGALCAVEPDGAVALTTGLVIVAHTAKTHLFVRDDTAGKVVVSITHAAGAKTLYVNFNWQGKIFTSGAVTFAA